MPQEMPPSVASPTGYDPSERTAAMPHAGLLTVLRDPRTVRARCSAITRAVADDRSGWFRLDRSRLPIAAARVVAVMQRRFPDGRIPLHSRWRHFEAGGVDRKAELDAALAHLSVADRARAQVDLTVISALLDADAGPQWGYTDRPAALPTAALPAHRASRDDLMAALDQASTSMRTSTAVPPPDAEPTASGIAHGRHEHAEGLGVASFRAFMAGVFSSDKADPCRVDAAALRQVDAAVLRAVFQSSPSNALAGLEGRAGLLSRLGDVLAFEARRDGLQPRPSLIFDRVTAGGTRTEVTAAALLQQVLQALGPIWISGGMVMGVRAGDAWPHRWAGMDTGDGDDPVTRGWVPFHMLSQWLTYSLVEPLQGAGVTVSGLEVLTGLPEYRNGGLLIDCGVLVPRSPRSLEQRWKPGDEIIIEWRALTVTLLDELAEQVRSQLGVDAAGMPLARILEGGTGVAGREIAVDLRGGAPPLQIDSDGTVF